MGPPQEKSLREQLTWGVVTAIPMSLMSIASCATYAQLLTIDNPMSASYLASANLFCSALTAVLMNYSSHCPFTISSPDMTNNLVLKYVLDNIAHKWHPSESAEAVPYLIVSLHITSVLLGVLFFLVGKARAAVALSYLPYPVVAGFLACVGGAVVKGAWLLMIPTPGQSNLPLIIGVCLAVVAFVLKKQYGIPTNLSSVLTIVGSLAIFYTWVFVTGKTMDELRVEGWLFAGKVQPIGAIGIFELDWRKVVGHGVVYPSADILTLAFVACLNRALTVTGIESASAGEPYSIDDEMKSTSYATIGVGLVGGVAIGPAAGLSSLCKEGANDDPRIGRWAAIIVGLLQFLVWASGLPLTNYLPRFLLGGLLMMMGVSMLVDWVFGVHRRVQWTGSLVIYGMLFWSLWFGLMEAIVAGIVLALFRLNIRLSQLMVLKYHVTGEHYRSGEFYDKSQRGVLRKHGGRTQIVGITGFLFEGVAISLSKYLKEVLRTSKELETLILDFFACQGINDSACAHIMKVVQLCAGRCVKLVVCHLSDKDEELLRIWGKENEYFQITDSLSEALSTTERETLENEAVRCQPVRPKSTDGSSERFALVKWLGEDVADALLAAGTLKTIPKGLALSTQAKTPTEVFIAIPGHSDVRCEVRTGTERGTAKLLRTTHGAVCAAEGLIETQSRGTWRTMFDSVCVSMTTQAACESIALPTLFALAFNQQCQQADQFSSIYTVNRGGGWHGITFDAATKAGKDHQYLSTHQSRSPGRKVSAVAPSKPYEIHGASISAPLLTLGAANAADDAPLARQHSAECHRVTAEEEDQPVAAVIARGESPKLGPTLPPVLSFSGQDLSSLGMMRVSSSGQDLSSMGMKRVKSGEGDLFLFGEDLADSGQHLSSMGSKRVTSMNRISSDDDFLLNRFSANASMPHVKQHLARMGRNPAQFSPPQQNLDDMFSTSLGSETSSACDLGSMMLPSGMIPPSIAEADPQDSEDLESATASEARSTDASEALPLRRDSSRVNKGSVIALAIGQASRALFTADKNPRDCALQLDDGGLASVSSQSPNSPRISRGLRGLRERARTLG